ncbi:hypothetical protein MP228_005121 [Amoeboaphelidium protococcarum]|nr:hypothetical protein MP228_005121 [Amoeboaphelidium protococcarum]
MQMSMNGTILSEDTDNENFYDAQEDFSEVVLKAFPPQQPVDDGRGSFMRTPSIVVTDDNNVSTSPAIDTLPRQNAQDKQSAAVIDDVTQELKQLDVLSNYKSSKMLEPVDQVMVKDLDSGQLLDADALHEEYKLKSRLGNNPLNQLIIQRSGQSAADLASDDSDEEQNGINNDSQQAQLQVGALQQNRNRANSVGKQLNKSATKTKEFFSSLKRKVSNSLKNQGYGSDTSTVDTEFTASTFNPSRYVKMKSKHVKMRQFNRLVMVQELVKGMPQTGISVKLKQSSSQSQLQQAQLKANQDQQQQNGQQSQQQNQQDQAQSEQTTQEDGADSCRGPIWAMKFNRDGRYLATGGQDAVLRVWSLVTNMDGDLNEQQEPSSLPSQQNGENTFARQETVDSKVNMMSSSSTGFMKSIFKPQPHRVYKGHTADILDISWSKNDFLLSSSMDKTVRVWHISRLECLCVFQHTDYVTSIAFHPKDDRFFLAGCLDCRVRLWNIPEKKVMYWNELPEVHSLITAVGFTNDGKTVIAGSYLGACVFFEVEGLKYHTQVHARSTRGKNSRGEKITGIECMPNQPPGEEKVMITSNDSRIRVYNLRDKSLFCKYKGLSNYSSQIKATFSDDARYIISGSEDNYAYIWETFSDQQGINGNGMGGGGSLFSSHANPNASKSNTSLNSGGSKTNTNGGGGGSSFMHNFSSIGQSRRDRNNRYEAFAAHDSIVTCAMFVPSRIVQKLEEAGVVQGLDQINPQQQMEQSQVSSQGSQRAPQQYRPADGRLIITADYNGCVRIYENERFGTQSGVNQSSMSTFGSLRPGSIFGQQQQQKNGSQTVTKLSQSVAANSNTSLSSLPKVTEMTQQQQQQ